MSDTETIQQIAADLKTVKEDTRVLRHLVTGNGSPEKGMVVRLDRVEQAEKKRAGLIAGLTVGVLLLIASTAWERLVEKPRVTVQQVESVEVRP